MNEDKLIKDEQIFIQALKKAGWNGFRATPDMYTWYDSNEQYRLAITSGAYVKVIFSKEFAKAIWGEELVCICCGGATKPDRCRFSFKIEDSEPKHNFHLKEMVLEDDYLAYLEKYI